MTEPARQPLTCVRCWHAPASRLLVVRWREETLRLLCAGCSAKDETDAPGLPGFRSLTVLAVASVSGREGAVTEWALAYTHRPNLPGMLPRRVIQPYPDEAMAREAVAEILRMEPGDEPAVMCRQAGPWTPAPGEEDS